MNEFSILSLTPAGHPAPSIAIAACRAGALGVLDLEYSRDEGAARRGIAELDRFTTGEFGLKCNGAGLRALTLGTLPCPDRLRWLIVADPDAREFKDEIRALRSRGIRALLECTCPEEARIAEQVGVDGVIAKGNEAGGRVAQEGCFVLLQRFLNHLFVPVLAQGGIGPYTASACRAAGAAGVVLDSQLLLTRESPLSEAVRKRIAAMDGSESACLGSEIGAPYRICTRLGASATAALRETESTLARSENSPAANRRRWREEVARRAGWERPEEDLFLFGQDLGLAQPLADRYVTVGGVVDAIRQTARSQSRRAAGFRPLAEGSPLAASHGTKYPIVQGPMARISDVPAFALRVSQEGALPFVAVGWTTDEELEDLLGGTRECLGERPWGVGLLGFLPPGVYRRQLDQVFRYRPPFAIIAGGRPDQVNALEQGGVKAYLHIPSPGLLKMSIAAGARRFVFEGRESGGHVGPRSSFVLWEQMIAALLECVPGQGGAEDYHILFAGGIHDALSAAMVAAMAVPLLERGMRIGLQMGTAYLFTQEAVSTGAILEDFQEQVVRCDRTVLLEPGPGHTYRCVETPFAAAFREERRWLLSQGAPAGEIQQALEKLSIGRLRIASKGIEQVPPLPAPGQEAKLVRLEREARQAQGMYLIGELAVLRDRSVSVQALHRQVCVEGSKRLEALASARAPSASPVARPESPSDIAIVGMACVLPKAPDLRTYWENILNKVCAIREIPLERWDSNLYFASDPKARDKVYSKWGAFLDDIPFDPLKYGIPPNSLSSIEPLQLLTLEVASRALEDAGYARRPFPRERTSVILGISGSGELGQAYAFRSSLPMFFGDAAERITSHFDGCLPEWTEDSFPGILMNVTAGRIANRFDLGGTNFTVDGACASSLAAAYLAVKELESGSSDMVLVGGADTMQNPFTYFCFSKTQAFSPTGQARPLDRRADGIVIGEGIAVAVLKRLADAERDGDRIYAVIKAVGAGSDGRDKSMTAPRPEGQIRVLERAYRKAGFSPETVGLVEAHATGTEVGDQVETEALRRFLTSHRAGPKSCAVGSVKSMIGHTKSTAGIASLIKMALSLHHRVMPPTLGVETPAESIGSPDSPLYANTEARPWFHVRGRWPRRGGVSAFGFGGTNFHAVLEEYSGDFLGRPAGFTRSATRRRPNELFFWEAGSRRELIESIRSLEEALSRGAEPELDALAFSVNRGTEESNGEPGARSVRLALVADSIQDLRGKIERTMEALGAGPTRFWDRQGIYFTDQPIGGQGRLAFVFPGQGSQCLHMATDLAVALPAVEALFERSDRLLAERLARRLTEFIDPPPALTKEERASQEKALAQTFVAQPALGTVSLALFHLLRDLGIRPDMVAGHSYGEYVALCAAGALSEEDLIVVSEARGRFLAGGNGGSDLGTMAAVGAGIDRVSGILSGMEQIWIANCNSPGQTVISGTRPAIETAERLFAERKIPCRPIPVACGFHSPLVSRACGQLKEFLSSVEFRTPQVAVYSNATGKPYPHRPEEMPERLSSHLRSRVDFVREIESMYADGARIFVEVGPGRVLTGLIEQILGDRPHLAVASNRPGRSGFDQLHHAIGQIAVHGVPVKISRLYEGRGVPWIDHRSLKPEKDLADLSPTTWLVNGTRARPVKGNAPLRPDRPVTPLPLAASPENPTHPPTADEPERRASPYLSQIEPEPLRPVTGPEASAKQEALERPTAGRLGEAGVEATMARFQRLMDRFLDTQKEVMLRYLGHTAARPEHEAQAASVSPELQGSEAADRIRKPLNDPAPQDREDRPPAPPLAALAGNEATTEDRRKPPGEATARQEEGKATREELQAQLLHLVSERTGYPESMLGLDLDLEADLGIDSIKRIEILGTFVRTAASSSRTEIEGEMDGLASLRTLRDINRWIAGRIDPSEEGRARSEIRLPALTPPAGSISQEPGGDDAIPRFTLSLRPVSEAPATGALPLPGVVLVTDDGGGVGRELVSLLEGQGQSAVRVQEAADLKEAADGSFQAVLATPEGVSALLDLVRRRKGPPIGLVHLTPLNAAARNDVADLARWRDLHRSQVKSLFYLVRGLSGAPDRSADGVVRFVLAATGMGGGFAAEPLRTARDFFPGHGGIAGLLKCLALEWPGVRVRAVDLDPEERAAALARQLLAEMSLDDPYVEVGRAGGQRHVLEPTLSPLEEAAADSGIEIGEGSVLLVTGGARGITADVAIELARRYRPRLILVGRSPLPPPEEPQDTAGVSAPKELKAALIDRMRKAGETVEVARVETGYHRLIAEREIRSTLRAIRDAGSLVQYRQADVRDPAAFGGVLDEAYATHGRIDGVIHGAGIIEDRLVSEKTAESFDRVFDTKADSAFLLSRKLRPESLKFLVFFSSVAGRFGNRGQGDYAAANEVLNKLAVQLDRKWPARVVSINWGPWDRNGMVTPELKQQFSERGIRLIPREAGPARLCDELRCGRKGQAEVVLGGFDGWQAMPARTPAVPAAAFPLFGNGTRSVSLDPNRVESIRVLDPAKDLFLADHRLNGKPVLPAAFAMEFMAEVVMRQWPDLQVCRMKDVGVLRGLVLKNGPQAIRVEAREIASSPADPPEKTVQVRITEAQPGGRPYYQATVELSDRLPAPPFFDLVPSRALRRFPASIEEAYRRWLFHGPTLQCISRIEGINEEGIIATVVPSAPENCLADFPGGRWIIDPVVVDSGFQLAILWARIQHDFTPLPSRFPAYHRYGPLAGTEVRCYLRSFADPSSLVMRTNLYFVDASSGSVLGMFEQAESTCSRALNERIGVPLGEVPKVSR
jgi:acyl transferase domain-containing protein/NAD(P)H-dependent flavin oxidoreductase YrpB (nitropropane dioxygenase family)/NADP-dependent 3-hydroxy acid dehydrogenase YdfG